MIINYILMDINREVPTFAREYFPTCIFLNDNLLCFRKPFAQSFWLLIGEYLLSKFFCYHNQKRKSSIWVNMVVNLTTSCWRKRSILKLVLEIDCWYKTHSCSRFGRKNTLSTPLFFSISDWTKIGFNKFDYCTIFFKVQTLELL